MYSEIFVSMATATVSCVKMLSTEIDDLVSCLVVKCMGIVIATSLPTESKDQIMSTVEASLKQILDWCLESLQKVGFTLFNHIRNTVLKLRHCYVKVTSSYHVTSQRIQELLGAFFLT